MLEIVFAFVGAFFLSGSADPGEGDVSAGVAASALVGTEAGGVGGMAAAASDTAAGDGATCVAAEGGGCGPVGIRSDVADSVVLAAAGDGEEDTTVASAAEAGDCSVSALPPP